MQVGSLAFGRHGGAHVPQLKELRLTATTWQRLKVGGWGLWLCGSSSWCLMTRYWMHRDAWCCCPEFEEAQVHLGWHVSCAVYSGRTKCRLWARVAVVQRAAE